MPACVRVCVCVRVRSIFHALTCGSGPDISPLVVQPEFLEPRAVDVEAGHALLFPSWLLHTIPSRDSGAQARTGGVRTGHRAKQRIGK